MTKFAGDSIISAYVNMLDKTQSNHKLPEYSEIYLRLAFKQVNGKNHTILPDTLQLYRKLLVLNYCEEYPSIKSVIAIMERCFSVEDIYGIVAEQDDLLRKWWELGNNYSNKHSNNVRKRKISSLDEVESLKKEINI
ncbi:uncharacterized protein LOC135955833 [Calliphora vicina]|uniref:uncharacterized protein LOC135955833 n=1 Tax=Calliphora vicina TaxID=7373 RepID=UPI00325A84F2